jgi:hypothetical protein
VELWAKYIPDRGKRVQRHRGKRKRTWMVRRIYIEGQMNKKNHKEHGGS